MPTDATGWLQSTAFVWMKLFNSLFAQLFTSENSNIQCTGRVILCTCLFEHFYGISNPTTFSSVSMIFPHLQLIKVLRIWKKKKIRQIVGKKSFHCCFCVFVPFPFCCVPFFDAPANYAIHCWIQTARQPQKLPACCATAILRFIFISFFFYAIGWPGRDDYEIADDFFTRRHAQAQLW